jgi:glycolate oxidase iron-sulfur subunit
MLHLLSFNIPRRIIRVKERIIIMEDIKYQKELLKCVRCGSCKASCPTYEEMSTETTGARGRLALLWGLSAGQLTPSPYLNDRIFSCTLCGACTELCPPGVDIKEIMYHGRNILNRADKKRKLLRFLTRFSMKQPQLSWKLMSIARPLLFPYLLKKGVLPFRIELPERRLKDNLRVFTVSRKKGRVAVFTGCTVNFLLPHLGEALINVLHTIGYEVILPAGEVCCGVPLRTLGMEEEARRLARKNFGIFSKLNVDAVVSLCPTCTLAIGKEYPILIGEGIEKAEDISSFLSGRLDSSHFPFPASLKTALYHDPCHLKYGLGIKKEPRKLLKDSGVDLVNIEGERCCGFAGVFCFSNRQLSQGILDKCAGEYEKSDTDAVVTSCPGCLMQLSREIKNKSVVHLIEVLEESICREP